MSSLLWSLNFEVCGIFFFSQHRLLCIFWKVFLFCFGILAFWGTWNICRCLLSMVHSPLFSAHTDLGDMDISNCSSVSSRVPGRTPADGSEPVAPSLGLTTTPGWIHFSTIWYFLSVHLETPLSLLHVAWALSCCLL